MSEPLIALHNVSLTLPSNAGPVNILKEIGLSVSGGETIGITGPSGSGKTSLLMLIAGLERATFGTIHINGTDITALHENALALFRRQNIGVIFQSFHLIPTMTALENVAVPLELAGIADAGSRAREALAEVGLTHRLHHYPSQLSGGEQQRTALARAFVARPKLLLADEPTGNLDQENSRMVMELLLRLQADHNTTLLLITHDSAIAAKCSRLIRIRDGKIVPEENAAEENAAEENAAEENAA